jgi:hypothetical protein
MLRHGRLGEIKVFDHLLATTRTGAAELQQNADARWMRQCRQLVSQLLGRTGSVAPLLLEVSIHRPSSIDDEEPDRNAWKCLAARLLTATEPSSSVLR